MPDTQTRPQWWPFERRTLRRDQLIVERYDGTDGYQRRYSQRFVDNAVRQFDPVRFDALKVAVIIDGRYRDPVKVLYAIIDGQHRFGMAEAKGLEHVPCDVYTEAMDYRKRALEFYNLNRVKQMLGVNDGARALKEGEDEEFLGLLYLLEQHGFFLTGFRPANVNGHRVLHATNTLQHAYALDARALEETLTVLQPWQPIINRRHERLVIGALMLWCRRDNIDVERLRSVLEHNGPDTLMREAGDVAARHGRANPNPKHMANAIRGFYNTNLRTRRIDEPF